MRSVYEIDFRLERLEKHRLLQSELLGRNFLLNENKRGRYLGYLNSGKGTKVKNRCIEEKSLED